MASRPLEKALRFYRLSDTANELATAVRSGTDAGDLLFALRDPDPIDVATLRAYTGADVPAAISTAQFELALAWVPRAVPVSVHFYLNRRPIPGGSGTYEGGRAFFPIPDEMMVAPRSLTFALRFWQGSWGYQLWGRVGDRKFLLDSGSDPDATSTDDDVVLKTVNFEAP